MLKKIPLQSIKISLKRDLWFKAGKKRLTEQTGTSGSNGFFPGKTYLYPGTAK